MTRRAGHRYRPIRRGPSAAFSGGAFMVSPNPIDRYCQSATGFSASQRGRNKYRKRLESRVNRTKDGNMTVVDWSGHRTSADYSVSLPDRACRPDGESRKSRYRRCRSDHLATSSQSIRGFDLVPEADSASASAIPSSSKNSTAFTFRDS